MNQTAVVTGAGSGVGRAVAHALAAAGWSVACLGRREQTLCETASANAQRLATFVCDVSDPDQVQRTFDAVRDRFGAIHLLVNAAGTNLPRRGLDVLSNDDYLELIGTNLNGAFFCVQSVLPE